MAKTEARTEAAAPKRRNIAPLVAGVVRELAGGGWMRLVAQAGNVDMLRKREALERAYREEKGLPLDAAIPLADMVVLSMQAQVGTVLKEFGGFDEDDDGKELASKREDGSLHEENALRLLLLPDVQADFGEEVNRLNANAARNREVAEGNSPAPSAGT